MNSSRLYSSVLSGFPLLIIFPDQNRNFVMLETHQTSELKVSEKKLSSLNNSSDKGLMAARKHYNFLSRVFLTTDMITYWSVNEEPTWDFKNFDFCELIAGHCSADEVGLFAYLYTCLQNTTLLEWYWWRKTVLLSEILAERHLNSFSN